MNIIETVNQGGVILYPTDTIWGIGGDATNTKVIDKIFKIKERDPNKSLLILVDSYKMLQNYVTEIPHEIWDILEKSIEPTTIIYPNPKNLPKELLAKDGSIAIRVVGKGFAKDLIKATGKPLISTSANLSGEPNPETFDEINPLILQRVDYVVNLHRKATSAKPSKIIRWSAKKGVEIIRD
ncbi:MAG TPA: threonylcarbamoyl-AMP synthase [Flavobacteriia bacterium]|jgi:L-threonylcarbamoyladenylate synthase|nr:threonylcarbamoyl-AMP synthase [Flavobacteriia bacterium]